MRIYMLKKFKIPHPDSPLSLLAWQLVLFVYGAYIVLCFVMIAFHIESHDYAEIYLLMFSMIFELIVLGYL